MITKNCCWWLLFKLFIMYIISGCQELLQAEDAFSGWIRKQKRVFGKAFPAGGLCEQKNLFKFF